MDMTFAETRCLVECVCSGASVFIVLYIWLVTNSPQNDLMRPLALFVDMEDSKKVVLLSA